MFKPKKACMDVAITNSINETTVGW